MVDYAVLVASAVLYAVGIVAQSVAARRAGSRPGTGLGLLARLAADRLYLLGFAGQVGGFALAFFARASLPLYLVQAASSSAIGLATAFGVLVLGWRIRTGEALTLVLLAAGLVVLAGSSSASVATDLPPAGVAALAVVVLGIGLAMVPAGRAGTFLPAAVLSGVAFAVVAVASRTLAHLDLLALPGNPLTWLMLAAAVLGQASMAAALQRGAAAAVVATADATTIVLASVTGIAVLGDHVVAGQGAWVATGLAVVVCGVLLLGVQSRAGAPALAGEAA
ncbi:hypothetical protein AMES_7281 [Amycolatopsis mediterranei S699]|uniref:Integral membrane protein n=2 Tax=Amycolatopsis mediterranei TaxID=33910 RepID=A0A0H3DEH6_AMYMU|nr:hypothetical protein [Amycolatopsis mediterranei]ADJ49106.1 conserved hypothetical protein [Amycolatopsis mediterranei U32]AFO80814.1 hypothetical protein AMES_7281 [Amycolatopsis mediterranei S699]AGT87942.1 hypothetical protein B737_7281 [Amycolatopsis mediterranei RB]KDO04087.1 hypothetical protein DV26_46230 [Amycolatopsis mediterranei]KDU90003.1 hypothetical protein DV36_22285 [Amycolatopsis mediterranei]